MYRASLGPWMKSPGTTRKKPGVAFERGALRQRRAGCRRRDVRHAGGEVRLTRGRDRARSGRADHRDDLLVGNVLLRQRLCRRRSLLDRCVSGHELHLQPETGRKPLDGVLRPAQLSVAEEARTARERCHDRDLQGALAVDCLLSLDSPLWPSASRLRLLQESQQSRPRAPKRWPSSFVALPYGFVPNTGFRRIRRHSGSTCCPVNGSRVRQSQRVVSVMSTRLTAGTSRPASSCPRVRA